MMSSAPNPAVQQALSVAASEATVFSNKLGPVPQQAKVGPAAILGAAVFLGVMVASLTNSPSSEENEEY